MAIEKIGFSYPRGSLQSVFDREAVTALELSAMTAKKVDECVELVNGVELIASEATAVVDDMKLAQEQFLIDNADTRAQLITDNQSFLDGLETIHTTTQTSLTNSFNVFKTNIDNELADYTEDATTTLNNTKASLDLALSNYQSTVNLALSEFTNDINDTKTQIVNDATAVIENSSQQITDNVNSKLDTMTANGTLGNIINQELFADINNSIALNTVAITDNEPPSSNLWYDIKSETEFNVTDEMIFVEI